MLAKPQRFDYRRQKKDCPPMKYQTRNYQEGDAKKINDLFFSVSGNKRSEDAYIWQWHKAPAGSGEIWVIETTEASETNSVIGHHGLMPMYFTCGKKTYRAGKTENTMIHPAYRSKILYHGYEKRFLKNYSERFDLLFSTQGPTAALRQRKALGYDDTRHWLQFNLALHRLSLPRFLLARAELSLDLSKNPKYRVAIKALKLACRLLPRIPRSISGRGHAAKSLQNLQAYDDEAAKSVAFFDDFWRQASSQYPLTPRREKADLAWRFWDNPNVSYTTLVHPNGYAVVSRPHKYLFRLEDIVSNPYDAEHFTQLLTSVLEWCRKQRASILEFQTTDDPASPARLVSDSQFPCLDLKRLSCSARDKELPTMLRRVTGRGEEAGASVDDWYVTSIVMEGRS